MAYQVSFVFADTHGKYTLVMGFDDLSGLSNAHSFQFVSRFGYGRRKTRTQAFCTMCVLVGGEGVFFVGEMIGGLHLEDVYLTLFVGGPYDPGGDRDGGSGCSSFVDGCAQEWFLKVLGEWEYLGFGAGMKGVVQIFVRGELFSARL